MCKDKSKKGQSQINLTLFDTSTLSITPIAPIAPIAPIKSLKNPSSLCEKHPCNEKIMRVHLFRIEKTIIFAV